MALSVNQATKRNINYKQDIYNILESKYLCKKRTEKYPIPCYRK